MRQETWDRRQETRDRRCETVDMSHVALKEQCHKICNTFFYQKTTWALCIWIGKNDFAEKICFRKYICKFATKTCVCVVIDYADMVSAWLLTMLTWSRHGHWSMTTLTLSLHGHWLQWHCVRVLCRHCVRVVVDYVNTCQGTGSQWLCWHMVNYFTLEEEKLTIKVKKCCVHVVIDYTDMMSP